MEKSRLDLVLKSPFWGRLALTMPLVLDPATPTACTNGVTIRYNGQWVGALNRSARCGVFAHEIAHCAYLHFARRGNRDPEVWNIAGDMEINGGLRGSGFELPSGAIFPESYGFAPGQSAEQYYALLVAQSPDPDQGDDQGGGQGQSSDPGGQNEQGGGQSPTPDPGGCGGVEDCPTQGAGAADQVSGEWLQRTIAAVQAAEMHGRGDCPGGIKSFVSGMLKPKVDWRAVLRDFLDTAIPTDYSYRRPSRRGLAQGAIMPGLQYDQAGAIVIALDTSGSVSDTLLSQFWGEVQGILGAYRITADVVLCDAAVQAVYRDVTADDTIPTAAVGRGGTDFRPVFNWISDNQVDPQCLIYLTDLDGAFPDTEPDFPVLWVSPKGTHDPHYPWGAWVAID